MIDHTVCSLGFGEPRAIPATAIQRLLPYATSSGGFSDIWECSVSTLSGTRRVAVKSFRSRVNNLALEEKIGRGIRREALIWTHLSHENILPLEGFTEGYGPLPALVVPWMENGSLNAYLTRVVELSRDKKLDMLKQIAAGLQYLHDHEIIHGNLTPNNILIDREGRPYLTDFGLSMILTTSGSDTFTSYYSGSTRWMAPEILGFSEEELPLRPTKAADVYSYGCIMIQLLSGHPPYDSLRTAVQVLTAKLRGKQPFREFIGVHNDLKELLERCLSSSSEDRPSVADIRKFLWLHTNITETTKLLMSKLTVTKIPKAVLTRSDYFADNSMPLRCNWLRESSVIEVAVKTLTDGINSINDINKAYARIRREIYVSGKVKHENILPLYGMTMGFGILPSFVHPWMEGGSLHDYVKRERGLSAFQRLNILRDVADGIRYLHNKNIAHGNLTGDSVLVDGSGHVRIADFSHSVVLIEADDIIFSEQFPRDGRYIAPECIVPGGHAGLPKPTKTQDVYSYGCIAILVLSGQVPYWWISEESDVLAEKAKGTEPFSQTIEINDVHLNLVRQCLSAESSRPSMEKVLYLVLVQRFGVVDLTNSIERLSKEPQATGASSNVHMCRLRLTNIDVGVEQAVSRYQSLFMSNYAVVAVKEIRSTNDADMLKAINRLFREIKLWLSLQHDNIVPLWGVADGFSPVPALVSPWFKNGALTGYLLREHKMLSYSRKFGLLCDAARALQYLHSQDIVHGDLSGNNILIDGNGKASLADFGISALLPGRMSQALFPTNPGGTAPWMAPERLAFDDADMSPVFSPKSDVYSFGGIMLQVLEGLPPYHYIANYATIILYISQGRRPERPSPYLVIDDDWDFIQRCWSKDVECRPSDADIVSFVEGRAG